MSRIWREVFRSSAFLGFLFLTLCIAPTFSASIPAGGPPKAESSTTPNVVTPQVSSQLVASASETEKGLSPVGAPPLAASDDKKTEPSEGGEAPEKPAVASEVVDLMKDPYHNLTTMTSDRDEEPVVDSETDIVDDPHVNHNNNRTHEEEEESKKSSESPVESSTEQPAVVVSSTVSTTGSSTEQPAVAVSSTTSTTGSSTEEPAVAVSSTASTTGSSTEEPGVAVSSTESSTEGASVADCLTIASTDRSVHGVEDIEVVPIKNNGQDEKEMEQMKASDPDAAATAPPVSALVSQHEAHEHPVTGKGVSMNHTTQAAAILAGVLVLVALAGYLGLLFWRRVLEKRYGNREMLVNEDDDFKHFEL